ncbi:MAG: zinc-ribbon domain-containing protein [Nitrospirae bacterium]|nr:zinc-ribbon domain-containing protein [Nitrospirota bacterium]
MPKILIACPHCGFSKELASDAIPRGTVKVNCPKCRQAFPLAGNVRDAAPTPPSPPAPVTPRPEQERPAPQPPVQPPAPPAPAPPAAPEPPRPARPYSVDISDIVSAAGTGDEGIPVAEPEPEPEPAPRKPAPPRHSYSVDLSAIEAELEGVPDDELEAGPKPGTGRQTAGVRPAVASASRPETGAAPRPAPKAKGTGGGLSGISEMFDSAWDIYKERAVTLLVLTLLMTLVPALVIAAGAGAAALAASLSLAVAGVVALLGVVAGLAGAFWVFAGVISAIMDDGLGIKDALDVGRFKLWPMFWVMALSAFMVIGGYLFLIIPGIVFSVWFFLAIFLLMDQDGRGVSALLASREYVRGNGWGVFGRLLLLWGLSTFAGMIPFVGPLLSFLVWPYTIICGYLIYSDLKASKGEAEFTFSTGEKAKLIATGAFGYVLIPLLITAFIFSYAAKLGVSPRDVLALSGISLPSLSGSLSGLTGGLFEKDADVRQAYAEYRKALAEGDADTLKGHIAKDKAKDLEGPMAEVGLAMLKAFVPDNVTITDSSVDGDVAKLTLSAETEGGVMKGTATMVREDGDWKLSEENWEMNVGPPSMKLKGGRGAPDVEPLADNNLAAPSMYVTGLAQQFIKDKANPPRELITLTGHEGEVTGLEFLPSGRLVSASYDDYTVRMWDVATGAELASYKMENRPTGMAATPDGNTVILSDAYQNLTFLPVMGDLFGDAAVEAAGVGSTAQVAVSPNGQLLAAASFDKTVTLWDVPHRAKLRTIETPEPMRAVDFSPSGEILAASDSTNKFTLWDLRGGEGRTYVVSKVDGRSDVGSIDISPNSKYIATGHMDSSVTIWDAKEFKELQNFYVTDASTWKVLFSPDSGLLATAHANGDVYLWNPATAVKKATLKGNPGGVRSLAFNQEGSLLATGGPDFTIKIWGYDLAAASSGMGMTSGMGGMGDMGGTMSVTPKDETPSSPDTVTAAVGPNRFGPGSTGSMMSVYIYSINYKGMVRLNGKDFYEIKGERDMNYNYSGGGTDLQYGRNVFDVDYQALPDDPWTTELRIKVYEYNFDTNKEVVFADWKVTDKGGKREFVLELTE